ncbi:hypothetical protein E4U42_003142 [Claviceps africana]|uniref:S-adenosylmethionine-dependent methyltransferase n=1 Tax=Claviceps africana TaxID=83212 RepID=A0A8K0NJ28_9HYPO|nr:hypothetical protein E4U42_003142 [Claviceps africana]
MAVKRRNVQPPSISLPPLRDLPTLTAAQIGDAIHSLHELFCRLPTSLDFQSTDKIPLLTADSGYASETEANEETEAECLRRDEFERSFASRWLTGFIGRAFELPLEETISERFVDEACSILSCLTNESKEEFSGEKELGMTRGFSFFLRGEQICRIEVELYDTPMQTGDDHTDVGLQTWGASIALSEKIATNPEMFRLGKLGTSSSSRIVELGAGTGLLSLFLSRLMPYVTKSRPTIVATDYHPTVLANLRANITSHMETTPDAAPVLACHLDWSAPSRQEPLDQPADILIAADVTYAPEHAAWLRDCAKSLLRDTGVFWLMVSLRPNGKFAGISDSVEVAFGDDKECTRPDGKRLSISSIQRMEKKGEIGRADEVGYKLFEIGWI